MKLSICIPVYNEAITTLVTQLSQEIDKLPQQIVEIIVIDDCSAKEYQSLNANIEGIRYIQLEKNLGRGAIHNQFLAYAKGEFLLFIDSDATVPSNYVATYLKAINLKTKVIYGGFLCKENLLSLRNRYSKAREIQPAAYRNRYPYPSFKAVNFLIKKNCFARCLFNPELSNYGYVDYIFAQQLKNQNIAIYHLDNPVYHIDYSTNQAFLTKTEKALTKLYFLYKSPQYQSLVQGVKLIKFVRKIQTLHLNKLVLFCYKLIKNQLAYQLINNPKASLRLFDFYKLGYFLEQEH